MRWALLAALLSLPLRGAAQTAAMSDALVSGRLGVSTTATAARVQVAMSTAATTQFQVSGVDEAPFITLASSGAVGMGAQPAANLDISGSGDSGGAVLELDNGNSYPATGATQMSFGFNGGATRRHQIQSVHSANGDNNALNFYLWSPNQAASDLGNLGVASFIMATSTQGAVHVMPVATASSNLVELVISDGSTFGGGTLDRFSAGVHSSRALKTDISYLVPADEDQALAEVGALKHVHFRYKALKKGKLVRDKKQAMRRGLILEEAPQSVRGPGNTISMDDRLVNAELAMKALLRQMGEAKAEEAKLEGGR
jgi:hypothetical protein